MFISDWNHFSEYLHDVLCLPEHLGVRLCGRKDLKYLIGRQENQRDEKHKADKVEDSRGLGCFIFRVYRSEEVLKATNEPYELLLKSETISAYDFVSYCSQINTNHVN